MKKYFLLIILIAFSATSIMAQLRLTPEAGVAILKSGSYNAGVGARIGLGLRYSFNGEDNGFGIATGLYYQQRHATSFSGGELYGTEPGNKNQVTVPVVAGEVSVDIPNQMVISGGRFLDINTRRDYLQLPAMAQYAWKCGDDVRIHLAVGPYVAIGLTGKNKIKETSWQTDKPLSAKESSTNPFSTSQYDRLDWGVSAQTGVEVKNVAFLINYNTNLYKRKSQGKDNIISIGLGYTF